jgi:hypothetical protein
VGPRTPFEAKGNKFLRGRNGGFGGPLKKSARYRSCFFNTQLEPENKKSPVFLIDFLGKRDFLEMS